MQLGTMPAGKASKVRQREQAVKCTHAAAVVATCCCITASSQTRQQSGLHRTTTAADKHIGLAATAYAGQLTGNPRAWQLQAGAPCWQQLTRQPSR